MLGEMLLALAVVAVAYCVLDFVLCNTGQHVQWRLPILRDLVQVLIHFHEFHDWASNKFSEKKTDAIVLKFANYDVVGIVNPLDVKHILKDNWNNYVVSEGLRGNALRDIFGKGIFNADRNQWYLQRKHSSREFNANVFRTVMTQQFVEHTKKLEGLLVQAAVDGKLVDMHALFFRLTLDAFGKVAFGVNIGGLDGNPIEFATAFDRAQEISAWRVVKPPIVWKVMRMLRVGEEKELTQCLGLIDTFVRNLVKERGGAHQADMDDLLSKLLRACESDNEIPQEERAQYLRDMTVNFIIAGRDTTACALSWFIYELSKAPEVEKKLLEEMESVFQGRQPSYDDLNECHFLTACLSEALRLHPSVPLDIKTAVADDVLPSGTKVRAGHTVGYLPYAMARQQRIWGEDAVEFNPSRWLDSAGTFVRADPFKYPVFQAGPRMCLGVDMAMLEMKVVVSMLLPHLRFRVVKEPVYRVGLVLQMKTGLLTRIERR